MRQLPGLGVHVDASKHGGRTADCDVPYLMAMSCGPSLAAWASGRV